MGAHGTRISVQFDVTNQGHVTSVTQGTCSRSLLLTITCPRMSLPPAGDDPLGTFLAISGCSHLSDTDTPTPGSVSCGGPKSWWLLPGATKGNIPSITAGEAIVSRSLRSPWKETTAFPKIWSPLHKWIWKKIIIILPKCDIKITKYRPSSSFVCFFVSRNYLAEKTQQCKHLLSSYYRHK